MYRKRISDLKGPSMRLSYFANSLSRRSTSSSCSSCVRLIVASTPMAAVVSWPFRSSSATKASCRARWCLPNAACRRAWFKCSRRVARSMPHHTPQLSQMRSPQGHWQRRTCCRSGCLVGLSQAGQRCAGRAAWPMILQLLLRQLGFRCFHNSTLDMIEFPDPKVDFGFLSSSCTVAAG